MAFAHRHHYRFPLFSPVRYEVLDRAGFRNGYGTVTNLSSRGWKIYGNLSLQAGDVCSMKVRLSARKWVSILVGVVRWTRGEECGIETLVMNDESTEQLNQYIQERVNAL
ncbi:MAG: PilZ domain-containing protein [Nitrospira sp.]